MKTKLLTLFSLLALLLIYEQADAGDEDAQAEIDQIDQEIESVDDELADFAKAADAQDGYAEAVTSMSDTGEGGVNLGADASTWEETAEEVKETQEKVQEEVEETTQD